MVAGLAADFRRPGKSFERKPIALAEDLQGAFATQLAQPFVEFRETRVDLRQVRTEADVQRLPPGQFASAADLSGELRMMLQVVLDDVAVFQ